MPPAAPRFAPGALIADRYRLEAAIGEGGCGVVFLATQLALSRPVALKLMHPELLDAGLRARMLREAALAQRLEHPNTVRLLDFGSAVDGTVDGTPYLVFELLRGRTLEAAIRAGGGFAPARAQRIGAQILKALMEAHALGIVHRDVKPANVFLCDFQGEPDFVKVLDFGIAKGGGERRLTRPGQVIGTPAYMAPEQLRGGEATFASDLYALGLVLSEALSGAPVYRGANGVEIAAEQLSPRPVPHAPEVLRSPLAAVILGATLRISRHRERWYRGIVSAGTAAS